MSLFQMSILLFNGLILPGLQWLTAVLAGNTGILVLKCTLCFQDIYIVLLKNRLSAEFIFPCLDSIISTSFSIRNLVSLDCITTWLVGNPKDRFFAQITRITIKLL